jgi:large subunit ribosomal protein L14e
MAIMEVVRYCVIVDKVDKNFVLIEGKGVKRKKTNVTHLEPLPIVLKISKGADDKAVVSALEKEGVY